jgi:hypothetical protein
VANFFKREAQFMMAWQILLPVIGSVIAIVTLLVLHIHKVPARVEPTPAGKSSTVPVASTSSPKEKSLEGGVVEPSNSVPSSIDAAPQTPPRTLDLVQPTFDRESYQREHSWLASQRFAWDQYQAIAISAPDDSSATGYVGVSFSHE